MRTALFFSSLFLLNCHPAYLSEVDYHNNTVAERASEIACDLHAFPYSGDEFTSVVGSYEDLSSDSGVMLVFYEHRDVSDEVWVFDAEHQYFSIVSSELMGNDEEIFLYNVSFSIDLTDTHVNPAISSFFTNNGFQDLRDEEEIWFYVWAIDEGELKTVELPISAAGMEEEMGSCVLLE